MKYLLLILILIPELTGCYTQKKATEQVEKANDKFPAIVAKLSRDKYPCTDLLKPDTTIIYEDSIILVEIECPDVPTEVIRVDTVNNVITRTVRVPVNMPVQIRTVTKWYEDSAKLKLFTLQVESLQADTASLRQETVKLSGKVSSRNKWLLWLIIICVCETLWILRKPIIRLFKLII